MEQMFEWLQTLCPVPGPSGYEQPVVQTARDLLTGLADEIRVDSVGNLLALRRCGKPNAKKLLLDAHLDQVGLLVTGHQDGFLQFSSVGGIDARMLTDQTVTMLTDPPRTGVIACPPAAALEDKKRGQAVPLEEMRIDAGLSPDQARQQIPVGTLCVLQGRCFALGDRQVCATALDDRSCFACLLRVLQLLRDESLEIDLCIVGSSREEVPGSGIVPAMWTQAPDWCVAVDVTHAQTPDCNKDWINVLGQGPAVGLGPNITRWMGRRLLDLAEERQIPVQREVMSGSSGTNGWEMQISREGVPTAVLSLPIKYMHSPVEVLDLDDMEALAQLLAAFARTLGKEAEP